MDSVWSIYTRLNWQLWCRSGWSWCQIQWSPGNQSHGLLHDHHCYRCSPGSHPCVTHPSRQPQIEGKSGRRREKWRCVQLRCLLRSNQESVPWKPGASLFPTGNKMLWIPTLSMSEGLVSLQDRALPFYSNYNQLFPWILRWNCQLEKEA